MKEERLIGNSGIGEVRQQCLNLLEEIRQSAGVLNEVFSLEENQEYIDVVLDSLGRVIFGVQQDGTFYVPLFYSPSIESRLKYLNDYFSETSGIEWLRVVLDSDGRILKGTKQDGTEVINTSLIVKGLLNCARVTVDGVLLENTTDVEGRLEVETDSIGRILSYRKKNGVKVEQGGLETPSLLAGSLNLTDEGMTEFQEALLRSGFSPGGKMDWSGNSYIYIPTEPTCATINISGIGSMPTSKTANYHAYMEYWDKNGNYFKKKIIINAQGRSTLAMAKINFGIDLCEDDWIGDDTTTVKIGNWVSQDSFHFKAYYSDLFKFANITAYKLYLSFAKTMSIDDDKPYKEYFASKYNSTTSDIDDVEQNINDEAKCVPDGFPCMVYLNGTFYGLFIWQLKKHRDNYHLDRNATDNIHIDGDDNYVQLFSGHIDTEWHRTELRNPKPKKSKWTMTCMDGSKYDGDNPKELIDSTSPLYDASNKSHKNSAKVKASVIALSHYMEDIAPYESTYMEATGDAKAEALLTLNGEIEKRFGVKWMIDYLILNNFIRNGDSVTQNGQWVTWGGSDGLLKWYIVPYDCDGSFGISAFIGRSFGGATFERSIGRDETTPLRYIFAYYRQDMEDRYKELRDKGILSYEAVIGIIREWIYRIGYDNYELEYEAWPESPCNRDGGFNDLWEALPSVWGQTNYITWSGSSSNYSPTANYGVGSKCKHHNRMFISKQANNVGHEPVSGVTDEWWEDVCPKPGTYNEGDEIWDGRCNFYKFRATRAVTITEDASSENRPDHLINTPLTYLYYGYPTEEGGFDSIYRISAWVRESLADMDNQFNYINNN